MVTADHIGHGRFGLNVVCGWNEGEFDMFGVDQRDHEGRYDHGDEWIKAVDAIWERDDFDFEGHYLHLKGVRAKPKPYRGTRPIVMNAAQSPAGRASPYAIVTHSLRRPVSPQISIRWRTRCAA